MLRPSAPRTARIFFTPRALARFLGLFEEEKEELEEEEVEENVLQEEEEEEEDDEDEEEVVVDTDLLLLTIRVVSLRPERCLCLSRILSPPDSLPFLTPKMMLADVLQFSIATQHLTHLGAK